MKETKVSMVYKSLYKALLGGAGNNSLVGLG